MFFDPVSSWLVVLIADGIAVSGGSGGKLDEYKRKLLRMTNESLNKEIRELKRLYGTRNPEETLEKISKRTTSARDWIVLNKCGGTLIVSLDNRDYIISLLEECERRYRCKIGIESKQKADWYKRKVEEAKKSKIVEKKRLIEEEKNRQRDNTVTFIVGAIGVLIFIFVLLCK